MVNNDVNETMQGSSRTGRRRGPRTPDDRLATWMRRLWWPVVILWLLAIVLLDPFASALSKATNNTASAYLPPAAQSTKVVNLQEGSSHLTSASP
ncbi:MAG: hypothetical protein FWE35_10040 [Streptosporangiales bacterium]|nr:hypothetical protein [Streptosporangiales bacterium]